MTLEPGQKTAAPAHTAIDHEAGQPYTIATPTPTLSLIIPTHNRAHLWNSGWLTKALARQSSKPDEILIAIDHCDDDTETAVRKALTGTRARILEMTGNQAAPFPASGIPDNCLFHAATGDIFLHIDDDIAMPPDLIAHTRHLFVGLPSTSIWYCMNFTDDKHNLIPAGQDWRLPLTAKTPLLPGGLSRALRGSSSCTGAIFACTTRDIRAIGGHALEYVGFHNQDTRLGARLERYCAGGSYICPTSRMTSDHLDLTWHMLHRDNPHALKQAYGAPPVGPVIANHGLYFWTSSWFDSAYRELDLCT